MKPRQGDIVLIPVPFTDLSSRKRRPVVVVSSNEYIDTGPDIVVVAMTSNPTLTPWSLPIETNDLRAGRLNRPGTIRVDKIYTLAQSLVVNRFGSVSAAMLQRIHQTLDRVIPPRPSNRSVRAACRLTPPDDHPRTPRDRARDSRPHHARPHR
ncbi:MAG: type II toxin-antitoxin system PemK/MazF family toxin [Planctomycetaceae bacterium]